MIKDDHRQTIADSNQELRGEQSGKSDGTAAEENRKRREKQAPESAEPIVEENHE